MASAAFVSGVSAQTTNVAVYGIVDMAYVYAHATGSEKLRALDSGVWSTSRLGFRGEELLGNGIRAIFTLEYSLAADLNTAIGTGGSATRQAYVGLEGPYGVLVAGRVQSAGKLAFDKFVAMSGGTFSPLESVANNPPTRAHTLTTKSAGRLSNAVSFTSRPVLGGGAKEGLVFTGQYALGGYSSNDNVPVAGAAEQERTVALGLDYTVGPFSLGYVDQRTRNIGNSLSHDRATEKLLGASYSFKTVTVLAAMQSINKTVAGMNLPTDKMFGLSARIALSPVDRVAIGYAHGNDGAPANLNSRGWGGQYSHDLSKRTMLYGGLQRIAGAPISHAAPRPGGHAVSYALGLRHTF